jgi:HD-GYP domain-containing protein (c-di-GMP phosphodiesterase class II)
MPTHASPEAVLEAGQFLRALSSAVQSDKLYPAAHPNRVSVLTETHTHARELQRSRGEDPVIFVARHSFYLGPTLLPAETLALDRLLQVLEKSGVEAIEIRPAVNEEDLDQLIAYLLGDLENVPSTTGLAVNRVRPSLGGGEDWQRGMTEMRKSYALGLELLRHATMGIDAGRSLDLEAPARLVQKMADQVAEDPAHAVLLTVVKSHDEYTFYHMLNVCLLSLAMGFAVGLAPEQVVALGVGALLHDVGKVNVPGEILRQVGPLSEEQWRLIQRHPVDGAGLIFGTSDDLVAPTASIVLEHHAAYDLSGYPTLSGRPHPSVPARMVAVADCFDAVTTDRPYRKAEERRQALNILLSGAGRGFDPRVVRSFVRLLGVFPVGSLVLLQDGRVGVVVRNHEQMLARPRVRLVLDAKGNTMEPEELDLSEQRSDGSFRWGVQRSMDPAEVGLDLSSLLFSDELREAGIHPEGAPGLVHEPSFGERKPPGYVDTHNAPVHTAGAQTSQAVETVHGE